MTWDCTSTALPQRTSAGDHPETADSDAKNAVDGNDRIMRTDVIPLDYQQTDLTWDAGLVYYSALGGYAYDDRWGRMTYRDFFKRRLIRLHPMVVMGMLIGAAAFSFGA